MYKTPESQDDQSFFDTTSMIMQLLVLYSRLASALAILRMLLAIPSAAIINIIHTAVLPAVAPSPWSCAPGHSSPTPFAILSTLLPAISLRATILG
jgi:hypothetical protein